MRIQRRVDLISLRHSPSGLTNNGMTAWVISGRPRVWYQIHLLWERQAK